MVLALLEPTPEMRVADYGAGRGFFAFELAGAISDAGRVLAIDSDPECLHMLGERARSLDLAIETRLASRRRQWAFWLPANLRKLLTGQGRWRWRAPSTPLGDDRFDRILMVNVFGFTPRHAPHLRELADSLDDDGLLVIHQDWVNRSAGPERSLPMHEVVGLAPPTLVVEEALRAGWLAGDSEREPGYLLALRRRSADVGDLVCGTPTAVRALKSRVSAGRALIESLPHPVRSPGRFCRAALEALRDEDVRPVRATLVKRVTDALSEVVQRHDYREALELVAGLQDGLGDCPVDRELAAQLERSASAARHRQEIEGRIAQRDWCGAWERVQRLRSTGAAEWQRISGPVERDLRQALSDALRSPGYAALVDHPDQATAAAACLRRSLTEELANGRISPTVPVLAALQRDKDPRWLAVRVPVLAALRQALERTGCPAEEREAHLALLTDA